MIYDMIRYGMVWYVMVWYGMVFGTEALFLIDGVVFHKTGDRTEIHQKFKF